MTFGEDAGGAGSSVEESEKILATYLDLGGNFIDTANFYTNGHSEKILGDWFAAHPGRRERVVLASKFFTNLYPGDPNGGGAGRASIIRQLDETLRRLSSTRCWPAPSRVRSRRSRVTRAWRWSPGVR